MEYAGKELYALLGVFSLTQAVRQTIGPVVVECH